MTYQDKEIAIVGLGYVGLPLAVAFGKKYKTIGFDINQKRIEDLKEFNDRTLEVTKGEIKKSQFLEFTSNQEQMRNCSIYVNFLLYVLHLHKIIYFHHQDFYGMFLK